MPYIDPHIHMVSRTTDDYARMAEAGCIAVTEPAFWAGFDRSSPAGFSDYFRQLTETEPKRAARYGIAHYCWLCINPKEAEDPGFAREVMALIPEFLDRPNVLGIGEIGLNKNSRNELEILEEQIDLARRHDRLILVHTPHLEDKLKGTRLIMDALGNAGRRSGPGADRPRRGAHRRRGARPRLLGRHDALSRQQVHAPAGRRHHRVLRQRADLDQLRRRLGPERPALGAEVPRRDAAARATGPTWPTKISLENPLTFLGQCSAFKPPGAP